MRKFSQDMFDYFSKQRFSISLIYYYIGFLAVNLGFAFAVLSLFYNLNDLSHKLLLLLLVVLWISGNLVGFPTSLQKGPAAGQTE